MCEYCEKKKPMFGDSEYGTSRASIQIINCNKANIKYYDARYFNGTEAVAIKINYCPICGRKLDEVTE